MLRVSQEFSLAFNDSHLLSATPRNMRATCDARALAKILAIHGADCDTFVSPKTIASASVLALKRRRFKPVERRRLSHLANTRPPRPATVLGGGANLSRLRFPQLIAKGRGPMGLA
jgi:hypothetical protein